MHTQQRVSDSNGVTIPVVRIDCATALLTYTSIGAAGDESSLQPRSWLESATWRIQFLPSPGVPAPQSRSG